MKQKMMRLARLARDNAARLGVSVFVLGTASAHAAVPAAVTTAITDAGTDMVTAVTAIIVAFVAFWGIKKLGARFAPTS